MAERYHNSNLILFRKDIEEIQQSREKFHYASISSIFDKSDEIVMFFNSQLNLIYANKYFLKLFGFSKNEVFGKNFTDFFLPQKIYQNDKTFLKDLKKKDDNGYYFAKKQDGSLVKCYLKKSILKNEFGNNFTLQFIGKISFNEKTILDQYLLDTSRLSNILKSFVDYLFIIDMNGYILDFISVKSKNLINETEIPLGKKIQDVLLIDTQIRKKVIRNIFKAVLKNSSQTLEIFDPQTSKIYQIKITPSNENYFIIFIKDVTNLRISSEEKKHLESYLKQIWGNAQDGLMLLDKNGFVVDVNASLCSIFDLKDNYEIVGKNFVELFYLNENQRHDYLNTFRRNFEAKNFSNNQEVDLIIHTGERRYFIVKYSFIEIAGKENNYSHTKPFLLCIYKDITESKLQANALKIKEELYHSLINTSSDGIIITDLFGRILNINNRALEMFRYEKTVDVLHSNITALFSSGQKEKTDSLIKNAIDNGAIIDEEIQIHRNDSSLFYVNVNASSLLGNDNKPYALMFFIKDISEKRELEDELENSKFLTTVGKMASYISHQIKTPLSAIKMNIDILQHKLVLDDLEKKSFEIISKEIKRLTGLTKNILIFSKEAKPKFEKVNLFQVIESIKFLLKPMLDEKKIVFHNLLNNIYVKGDMILLQSLFLQLIENSMESIEKNGLIEINHSEYHSDKTYSIFIKDNGCGIIDKEKVFEPFFTTKSAGTGLGVPIAERIVKQHNGTINLISSKKGETIFKIVINKYE